MFRCFQYLYYYINLLIITYIIKYTYRFYKNRIRGTFLGVSDCRFWVGGRWLVDDGWIATIMMYPQCSCCRSFLFILILNKGIVVMMVLERQLIRVNTLTFFVVFVFQRWLFCTFNTNIIFDLGFWLKDENSLLVDRQVGGGGCFGCFSFSVQNVQ